MYERARARVSVGEERFWCICICDSSQILAHPHKSTLIREVNVPGVGTIYHPAGGLSSPGLTERRDTVEFKISQ